jgi:hypothetical protein
MSNTTGYEKTYYAYAKMRMASYNYFKATDVFHIQVKVLTANEYKNYKMIEYMVNDPPVTKSLIITSGDKYHNYTMVTLFNITTVNNSASPSSWYDVSSDTKNQLYYRLYIDTGSTRFLIKPFTF